MLVVSGLCATSVHADHVAGTGAHFGYSMAVIDSGIEKYKFRVEVAKSVAERAQGLQHRENLPNNEGMLFDFGHTRPVSMWMKNTAIPLDMLFIKDTGEIHRVVSDTEPFSLEHIASGAPVRAVLELRAGTAKSLGIEAGDRLVFPVFK